MLIYVGLFQSHDLHESFLHQNQAANAEVNMSTPLKVVLLACGSYNPITNMHLRMFGKATLFWESFIVVEYS